MESSASTGTDGAAVTAPLSCSRAGQVIDELGKKLLLARLPSPSSHRNNSQPGSEQEEKVQHGHPEKAHQAHQSHAGAYLLAGNSWPAATMDTDFEDEKITAEALHGIDMDTAAETEDHVYQVGKQVPRCDSQNLDFGPDYGRREALQPGESRHICRYCAKEFSSGRALGGHMRAHGSLTVEEGPACPTNAEGAEKLQPSGSIGHNHASQFLINNTTANGGTDSGSDHTLSNSVKQGGPPRPPSKRSRTSGREIQSGRSVKGCLRSNHSAKQRKITPKNSEEKGDATQRDEGEDEDEHDNAAAPMTGLKQSLSSDDDGNKEEANGEDVVPDGMANICNVCDREFETGKQLSSHKKSHEQYALRRNPRRTQKFIDQDFTAEATSASVPAKKASSAFSPDGNMRTCTECGKRFQSWKALFGHMRCHPERNWRGINRPDAAKDKQQLLLEGTSSAERQETGASRRKDALASAAAADVPRVAPQEYDSESEAEARGALVFTSHGKSAAAASAAAAAAASDNESDTESIEAAYMSGERQPSTSTWRWTTVVKRSKRSRQTVRSLQAVTRTAAAPSIMPGENEMEHETAMGLMMLARKEGGQNWLDGSCDQNQLRPKELHENASSETEGDEELEEENAGDFEEEEDDDAAELLAQKRQLTQSKGKAKLEAADSLSLCEEIEEGGDDCEDGGQQGAGNIKPKYVCNTCRRVFKSHQALGGHRASHKKVKGCYAKNGLTRLVQPNPDEEMMSEEVSGSDDDRQPPTVRQDLLQSEGDEREKQLQQYHAAPFSGKEDCGESAVNNLNHNNGSRSSRSKGHLCTICGRIFNSGQALGGHKRCHYNTKEGTSSEATSSTNTNRQAIAAVQLHHGASGKVYKEEFTQHGRPLDDGSSAPQMHRGRPKSEEYVQPAAQPSVRPVKEKCLDLNLPAPLNDDDLEMEAYEIPPTDLMCMPVPQSIELKATIGIVKGGGTTFDVGEAETSKAKEEYYPLYTAGKTYASLVDEKGQDLGGSQDAGFRGGEVDFSLRYVRCHICSSQFSTVEALNNHEKTHAAMVSAVSGLTPISA